jgi:histidinol-phosphate aminotransferase
MSVLDHLNPTLADLPVYQPGRPIEEVAREHGLRPGDVIKLASNENPLGPSPLAVAAMEKAVRQMNLYPDGNAFYLKRRLAEKLGVKPGNLILGNGSNEIIEFVGHALMRPGAEVVVSQYCFAVYPILAHLMGAPLVVVAAKDFGHDLDAMARAITPSTRLVFVANPNNPTGTCATKEELSRFVERIPEDVLLVLDEAYIEFLDDPSDFRARLLDGRHPNLILMRTFSKIYGLAGLRLGYGLADARLIAAFEKIRQPFNANAMAQAAALAALDDDAHLRATRENNQRGLKFFENEFQRARMEFVPSRANFILVRVGDGSQVFGELQRRGVIVRPMASYQLPEWIRISIGTEAENRRCMAALRGTLAGLPCS